MASVLEAMGFPRGWCERALRASGGVEPAVELLLQWQADGEEDPDAASPPAVSTVTDVAAAGLDAVVPDAGIVEQTIRACEKVEDDDRWSRKETPVELHIRCSGHPTIKGTFSAGATLKEVRDFVLRELQTQQQQPVAPASTTPHRSRRTSSRSNGISALLPSARVNQRIKKMSRYADPSSSATSARPVAIGSFYFLIPFPRTVFDTEDLMETTLFDANLYPRGILTVQFKSKEEGPSTSESVTPQVERNLVDHQRVEDVARREKRLKATLDRYGSEQLYARNTTDEVPETRGAASASMPAMAGREERILEVDGERVRHRELALQAAAKRMTEAAQLFREGFLPDEGEPGGGFRSPSPSTACNDDVSRVVSEDLDVSKGKQVAAECGPSSPAREPVHDVGSNFAGFQGRASRARFPLPAPSPSRPQKLQRTDELSSTRSAGANHVPRLFASGHAIERVPRGGHQTSPPEMWIRGSPGSGSSSVSELRIRLEDGSVLRRTFPAYTTLQSVVECAMPVRQSTVEYGLVLKTPGSQFFEGEALGQTLEEVGLVPSGVVHLQKVASRGLVTQGSRRRALRMIRYLRNRNNEPEPELEQLWHDFSRRVNTNLTYEELVELEDSIGRVNVGLPEATIANLPTHTVSRSAGDICIVCLSEMVEGEEVMLLPCLHTFHPACIRQWLLQATCCPTCKHHIN